MREANKQGNQDPQSGGLDSTSVNLTLLMNHQSIVQNVQIYVPDIASANALGFDYVLGETNSGMFCFSSLHILTQHLHLLQNNMN